MYNQHLMIMVLACATIFCCCLLALACARLKDVCELCQMILMEDETCVTDVEMIVATRLQNRAHCAGMNHLTVELHGEIYHFAWEPGDFRRAIAWICDMEGDPDLPWVTEEVALDWIDMVGLIELDNSLTKGIGNARVIAKKR